MYWSHWSFGVQTLAHTRPVYLSRWVFSKLLRPVKVYIGICRDAQQSPEINQPREIRDNRRGLFSERNSTTTHTHIYIYFIFIIHYPIDWMIFLHKSYPIVDSIRDIES